MASSKSRRRSGTRAASFDPFRFALDSQIVIALRLTRIAAGGGEARREAGRMVAEKFAAAVHANMVAGTAFLMGEPALAANRATAVYRRAVTANLRRLTRVG